MPNVYLDHAATTPLDPRVLEAMLPYLKENFGNPSSFHSVGKDAKDALDDAREEMAKILHVRADELLFTSGGTESDNLAVLGFCRANQSHGKHLVVTAFEHHAVIEAAMHLEKKEGFEVTYLSPDHDGMISLEQVMAAIRPDTILVSVMYANNEIGTIQPIGEIGNAIQKHRKQNPNTMPCLQPGNFQFPVFHTDACQATGALDLDVEKLHVDLMTINGSKMYGPKGVGALYVRRGVKIQPLQFGGSQEKGIRPGTENVAGIIGMAKALEIAQGERVAESQRLVVLRDMLIAGIRERVPKVRLNGHPTKRLPNNVNISFMDLEGEAFILYLDASGIYASTGSACTSTTLDPSHVILALGLPYEVAHGSVRFSLGHSTTADDIQYVLETIPPLVAKLRALSPVRVDPKYYV
ncbi:MAG: cysteine desulfurase family protein [Candidatus Uhrbacteria bacterium]